MRKNKTVQNLHYSPQKAGKLIAFNEFGAVYALAGMFRRFHEMVKPGGFIAISDLDKEDGSFHTEDTGVFHFGFDREEIGSAATQAGFENVEVVPASIIERETGDYPVFLLIASRP
tara:strand:- start:327 stop:674 length:348 start_codon:yes stop_codon:yes gene_type:complete